MIQGVNRQGWSSGGVLVFAHKLLSNKRALGRPVASLSRASLTRQNQHRTAMTKQSLGVEQWGIRDPIASLARLCMEKTKKKRAGKARVFVIKRCPLFNVNSLLYKKENWLWETSPP